MSAIGYRTPAERHVRVEQLFRYGTSLPKIGPYELDGRAGRIVSVEPLTLRPIHRKMWQVRPGDFVVSFVWEPKE